MSITDLIRRSGRNLKSAKGRTILTALAIAVGTFALTLTLAASNGATKFVNKLISDNFDPAELIVSADSTIFGRGDRAKPREYDPSFGTTSTNAGATTQIKRITQEDINKISTIPVVEKIRKEIAVNARYITREGQKKYVGTLATYNPSQKPQLLAGEISNDFSGNSVILPEAYLNSLGFSSPNEAVGKTLTVLIPKPLSADELRQQLIQGLLPTSSQEIAKQAEKNSVEENFKIIAVSKKPNTSQPGTELYLYVPEGTAEQLNEISTQSTENYQKYNYIYVKVKDGKNPEVLKKAQEELKNLGFQAQSVSETQEFLTNIIGVLQGIVAGFAAIAIIASVFGIINTMYISVLQRTREIGMMKALGMRRKDIGRLFRFEAAWIGLLGGSIGCTLAILLGLSLNPWITQKLNLGEGNSLLIFRPEQIALLVFILVIISIFAGWLPSRKAAKLDPIDALRTE